MLLKFDKFIIEGKYDRITGISVDELWKVIKLTKLSFDLDRKKYSKYIEIDIDHNFSGPIEFDLKLKIKRDSNYRKSIIIPNDYGFYIDGKCDALIGVIYIILELDPNKEPYCYNNLNLMLQDVIRHEIEHLTHEGYNRLSDRPNPDNSNELRYNISGVDSYLYFILEDELTPMIQGMYRKAKTSKKSITTIFNEYLDIMVDSGILKDYNRELIYDEWVKEAKRLLPNAKFDK